MTGCISYCTEYRLTVTTELLQQLSVIAGAEVRSWFQQELAGHGAQSEDVEDTP